MNEIYYSAYNTYNNSSTFENYLKYNAQSVCGTYSAPIFSELDNSNDNIRLLHKTNLLKIKHL